MNFVKVLIPVLCGYKKDNTIALGELKIDWIFIVRYRNCITISPD